MIKAIYKITNKINKKSYIGQSINPVRRFKEHCKNSTIIGKAIQSYGIDNFSFEILGWFEDYNEKEKYYIQYYHTLVPNGYNLQEGGQEPPLLKGENHPSHKISKQIAEKIQKDLLNFNIPKKQIIKKYKISYDILRHINEGNSWRNDSLQYPLRPTEKELNERKAKQIIKMLQETNLTHSEIGKKVGWNRSAVTMINIGKNHRQEGLEYPIRK